jgi:hypothetical protein|tara:strand:+ start:8322 stop:8888 length:567 start_codon:yes stop_codon:yes gene_type:complete
MDLSDAISEVETARDSADEARDYADSALDALREVQSLEEQLKTDWKEYLSDNVDTDELYEYLCEVGASDLNYIAKKSIAYADKQKESDQMQELYWEEVQVNNLARALMEAAFLAEAKSQTKWVEPLLDKFEQDKVNASFAESLRSDLRAGLVRADEADARFAKRDKLDRLWLVMKRVQSEIEELRGDA